jgi:hypothetical protein
MSLFEPYQSSRPTSAEPVVDLHIRSAVSDDKRHPCAIEAERLGSDPADLFPLIERSMAAVDPERWPLIAEIGTPLSGEPDTFDRPRMLHGTSRHMAGIWLVSSSRRNSGAEALDVS